VGVLVAFIALFALPDHLLPPHGARLLAASQLVPSVLAALDGNAGRVLLLVVLLLATALLGRVYCSVLCPLGILQDVVWRLRRRWAPVRLPNARAASRTRWISLGLGVAAFASGVGWAIGLIDPYSIFGRIASGLAHPATMPWPLLAIAAASLLLVGLLAWHRGRLYCNTLCPVGALLGLLSRRALFRIRIDPAHCVACSQCARVCRAQCIDIGKGTVDASRCTLCFDCLEVCPKAGIEWSPVADRPLDPSLSRPDADDLPSPARRRLLGGLLACSALGFGSAAARADRERPSRRTNTRARPHQRHEPRPLPPHPPPVAPGARSLARFRERCTACQLCVGRCPTGVLRPGFRNDGPGSFLQPGLDFDSGHCAYGCNQCGSICPTGALEPLEPEVKKRTAIGVARFERHNCILLGDEEECGKCADRCPTGAVQLTGRHRGRDVPEIDPETCIGCGACEHVCPAEPHKAIYVERFVVHGQAEPPRG